MRNRLPLLALGGLAALVAAATTTIAAPVRAASVPGAVNGAHATYRALPLPATLPRPTATDSWWFAGTQLDEANKQVNGPSATFSRQRPSADSDLVQLVGSGDPEAPASSDSAYWRAAYRGRIDGDLVFNWFFTTLEAEGQFQMDTTVTVFADTEIGSTPTKIGQSRVRVRAAPDPIATHTRVPVHGIVEHSLLIQVTRTILDVGPELRVLYGSTTHPSGFSLPKPGAGADRPSTTSAPASGERLDIQAVEIGRKAMEPTMGVDRRGNAFYVAATFDGPLGSGLNHSIVMRSRDAGDSWQEVSRVLAGDITIPPNTADPYLYVDVRTGRVFSIDLYLGCSHLVYSDDLGETWTSNPIACGEPVDDHQTLVSGVRPPGVTMLGEYPDVLYYCFSQLARAGCTRSLDGGLTFVAGRTDPYAGVEPDASKGFCDALHGRAVTDSRGRLFLPKGHCGFPWMAVSEDGGDTWRRSQISGAVSSSGVNVEAAVDEADNVYVVWWDEEYRLPWMAVSRDHGATWSVPLLVAPPDVKQVNFPSIAAGAAGRVAITFPGTTEVLDTDFRPWNSYVLVSTNALDPRPFFQSATANKSGDPIHRGPCEERCGWMLDFLHDIVSPQGEVWATVVDTCTTEGDCIKNNGPDLPERGVVAPSSDGIAVRQFCGPAMRGPSRDLHRSGCVTAAAVPASKPGGKRGRDGLPRTAG